jgi:uncharacterized protein with von Willebrand factor type A (vWA) domain
MKMLEERLREQHKKHQGGNRMIGTGGTSPLVLLAIILKVFVSVGQDVNVQL